MSADRIWPVTLPPLSGPAPLGALHGRTDPIVAAGSAPSGEGNTASGPVAAPAESDDLQAKLFQLVSEMRRKQKNDDLTTRPWSLDTIDEELETLVPRLAARIERLEAASLNQEAVIAMAAEVALHAAEKADSHICSFCANRLDAIGMEGR